MASFGGIARSGGLQMLRLRVRRIAGCDWLIAILLLSTVGSARGQQGAKPGVAQEVTVTAGLRAVSRQDYAAELARMGPVVEACRVRAEACDIKAAPADEKVDDDFEVHWDWLRQALKKGSDAKDKDRLEALDGASARLREDAAEVAASAAEVDDAAARRKLNEVLARREFGATQETNWWALLLAKLYGKVEKWWDGMAGVMPWAPWMGLAMEWGILGAAAVALIVWALRMSRQQRVSFAPEHKVATAWQAESDDWAAKAKAEAAKGEWRDAVHCLYWSAIVMLEGQRLWRQNRARTPREYVSLLEPGSARRRVLGGLTGVFERIWYGIRPATGEDYAKASALLDELRVG